MSYRLLRPGSPLPRPDDLPQHLAADWDKQTSAVNMARGMVVLGVALLVATPIFARDAAAAVFPALIGLGTAGAGLYLARAVARRIEQMRAGVDPWEGRRPAGPDTTGDR